MTLQQRVSLEHFLGCFTVFSIMGYLNYYNNISTLSENVLIFLICGLVIFGCLKLFFNGEVYQISWRSALLGALFSFGFNIYLICHPHIKVFGLYVAVISFFHFSEFFCMAMIQPVQISIDSFMLNHSREYIVAAVSSWLEFFVETFFYPDLKQHLYISYFGLLLCILGEFIRKLAMYTAGRNFNHLVQSEKAKDHTLVTEGIYSVCRHPSYVGWFYWAIGTQIILVNPICIAIYAVISWIFFKSRIYIEEITLLNFFGVNYVNYQKKVTTGIPFIKGYEI